MFSIFNSFLFLSLRISIPLRISSLIVTTHPECFSYNDPLVFAAAGSAAGLTQKIAVNGRV